MNEKQIKTTTKSNNQSIRWKKLLKNVEIFFKFKKIQKFLKMNEWMKWVMIFRKNLNVFFRLLWKRTNGRFSTRSRWIAPQTQSFPPYSDTGPSQRIPLKKDDKNEPIWFTRKIIYKYEPIWANTSQYEPIRANMSQYEPIRANTSQYEPIWANTSQYEPIWANMSQYEPIWANMSQYEPIWANMSQYEPIWANMSQYEPIWANMSQYESDMSPKKQQTDRVLGLRRRAAGSGVFSAFCLTCSGRTARPMASQLLPLLQPVLALGVRRIDSLPRNKARTAVPRRPCRASVSQTAAVFLKNQRKSIKDLGNGIKWKISKIPQGSDNKIKL